MAIQDLFSSNIEILVGKILSVIIIVVVASVIAKMSATAVSRFGRRTGLPQSITRLVNKTVTYFIGFIGFVLVLDIFKFNVTTFIASFGIVGLIIGLSSQAVISNFIAGVLILLEKPFYRGDIIDAAGFLGTVDDISIRSTRVRTIDGRLITVPNSTFTTSSVINYSKTGRLQVKIPVSFTPDVDISRVSEIMTSSARATDGVRPYHIDVLVTGMTLSGLSRNVTVELRFWINRVLERDIIISEVGGRIKDALVKERIIPAEK